jgi:uncharacterized membrane protein
MDEGAAPRWRLPVIVLVFIPVLFHLVIVETRHVRFAITPHLEPLFKLGFVAASAATHWAIYTALLLTFALTLRPGHDPLICALTRRLHGAIPDDLALYTRRVTIAWACFFAAQLGISIFLFIFAPLVVWSFFVNILDLPLVAAMFGAEYMVRQQCLRNPPRHSLAMVIRMVADIRKPHGEPAGLL